MSSLSGDGLLEILDTSMTRLYGLNAGTASLVALAAASREFSLNIDSPEPDVAIELAESVLALLPEISVVRTSQRRGNAYMTGDRIDVVLEDDDAQSRDYENFKKQMIRRGSAVRQTLDSRQELLELCRDKPLAALMFGHGKKAAIPRAEGIAVRMVSAGAYHDLRLDNELGSMLGRSLRLPQFVLTRLTQLSESEPNKDIRYDIDKRALKPNHIDAAMVCTIKHVLAVSRAIARLYSPTMPLVTRNDVGYALQLLEKAGAMVDTVSLSRYAIAFAECLPLLIQSVAQTDGVGAGSNAEHKVTIENLVEVSNRPIFADRARAFSDPSKRNKTKNDTPTTRAIIDARLKELIELDLVRMEWVGSTQLFGLTKSGRQFCEAGSLNRYHILYEHFKAFNQASSMI